MPLQKPYDLEQRSIQFSKELIAFVNTLKPTIANIEISKQVIRSAGSVGANYIEANEALGKRDFLMHIRIAKKEAKETQYWLKLLESTSALESKRDELIKEAVELMNILGAIAQKAKP